MATNTRDVRSLRLRLSLSERQRSVLVGSLLGDGSISGNMGEGIWNINYRFQVAHSNKQRGYLWWKYEVFHEWCLSPPQYQNTTNSWRFRTISHPIFTEFHKLFYNKQGRKILPGEIRNLIVDPIVLAVWFMDDGAKMANYGYIINSQNFSKNENRVLGDYFKDALDLHVSLHRDKDRWRIYVGKDSARKFGEIIKPYILPSMTYKLIVTP